MPFEYLGPVSLHSQLPAMRAARPKSARDKANLLHQLLISCLAGEEIGLTFE
jgi:hypothetical protein